MNIPIETIIAQLSDEIKTHFADVPIEFANQFFDEHVELWVYVLTPSRYDEIKDWCRDFAQRQGLDDQQPAIWIVVGTWTGPWRGGETDQELRRAARDAFRQRHGIPVPGEPTAP
jgi:hypothetical protein